MINPITIIQLEYLQRNFYVDQSKFDLDIWIHILHCPFSVFKMDRLYLRLNQLHIKSNEVNLKNK